MAPSATLVLDPGWLAGPGRRPTLALHARRCDSFIVPMVISTSAAHRNM